jgi:hypothetical protein
MPRKRTESNQTAAQIAEEKMPGWKAVKPSGPMKPFGRSEEYAGDNASENEMSPSRIDAVMPSLKQARRKFLGKDAADDADEADARPLENDVEIVDMKSGDLERTVGVNRKTKKIDWSAG